MPARRTPVLVLVIALTLTVLATAVVALTGRARDRVRFQNAAGTTAAAVDAQLRAYVAILRGGAGLLAASDSVSDEEFRVFAAQFALRDRYPGMQGLGFAPRVPAAAADSFVRARREAGFASFRIEPPDPAPERFPIAMIQPLDRRNAAALGYDMFGEPVRQAAMERARDTGAPAMSGHVVLVQEIDTLKQAGFLIYLPVYGAGDPPTDVAERRRRLRGFVYAPFRAGDLFAGVFAERTEAPVSFRVHDGLVPTDANLLHDSHPAGAARRGPPPAFTRLDTLDVYGRRWTVAYASLPSIEERSGRRLAPAVAAAGVLVSLLLFALTRAEAGARAAAERSERARGRFFAAMSHELRTPLNAIMGYNDLLLAGVYGALPPQLEDGIRRSQRAARHLRELVNDVLDISKLEAGRAELEAVEVHVPSLLEELAHTLEGLAAERGAPLRLECDGGGTVVSDPRRVQQILLNLLSNAVKFGAGHPVLVRCAPAPGGGVTVQVTDQGPGIAPEDQARIFEEFVQLPGTAAGGTGLGLPIARRLAHLLGGTLEVESARGAGSTFTLCLPKAPPGSSGPAS